MEKKERNIGVSGGWGGSVVGVKEPYRRPMIYNFVKFVCSDLVVVLNFHKGPVDFVPVSITHVPCSNPVQFTLE